MRRRLLALLALSLFALSIAAHPAYGEKGSDAPPPHLTNLIYNPGFETPDPSFPTRPDGWTMWYGGGLDAPTYTLTDPYQGLHSLAIDSHAGNYMVNVASRNFSLTPGNILRMRMAQRVPDWTPQGGYASILPEVEIYNNQNQLLAVDYFYLLVNSSQWREGPGANQFVVPAGGVTGRLVLHMEPLGAQHIDNIDSVLVWLSPPTSLSTAP